MARDLNYCQFVGQILDDPQTDQLSGGANVTRFSLGVAQKNGGALSVTCSVFGDLGEEVALYAAKGMRIFVAGRINLRSWVGKDNAKHYQLSLTVNDCLLGDGSVQADDEQPY